MHTFPKDKQIVCGEKLDKDQIRELIKACFEHGVEIYDGTLIKLQDNQYPYFIHTDEGILTQRADNKEIDNLFVVPYEEFMQYVRGECKFKESLIIKLQLNDQYEAVVTSTKVKVGCQTFTFETVIKLYKAVQKQKLTQNKRS